MDCEAGFGKCEITAWEPEMAMMGWGRMDNRIVGVHTPLFARAAAVRRGGQLVVFCAIELMAVSLAIREAVLEALAGELPIDEHNLMLTATHTHSGPSGYSHYFFINLNGPGYSPTVFDAAVEGTVTAIRDAVAALRPATMSLGEDTLPLQEPVAFNRSWSAYNLNDDVEPVSEDRRDEAVDRKMTVLVARDDHGAALGSIVWFPVHCTSVHAENDQLHSDNKGIAAAVLEEQHGDGYVAVCAQEAAGDVTPNFRYDPQRGKVIGKFDDDYRSADFNGRIQARFAARIEARATSLADGELRGATHYVDFSTIRVAQRHSGRPNARTTVATLGIAMAEGTDEGPGPLLAVRSVTRRLARLKSRRNPEDPKVGMLDVGRGLDARFLGLFHVRKMRIPPLDETLRYVRAVVKSGEMEEHPWIAQVLPLQLMQIGPLLLVGLPFEVTTVAGRRIRAHLGELFGTSHVIVSSYANGYAGYCTTSEEYRLQHYEAGYTLFGPHQLAATLTMLDWMHDRWGAEMPLGEAPPRFTQRALHSRLFTPWTVPTAERPW